MLSIVMTFHILGVVVWVGGMFFAHMALRPSAEETLTPVQRLPLLRATLERFFRWVWLAVVLILITGYWMYLVAFQGQAGGYLHLMQLFGLLMSGLFGYIYFFPFRRLRRALDAGEIPAAGQAMAIIRRIIAVNLTLGLITVAAAVSKLG